jgi:membrane protein
MQVAGIAFLLLVSLTISAALSAVGALMGRHITARETLLHGLDFILSCGVITTLFAMIFKTLPEAFIAWGDVWIGAAATAFLFTIGKLLVGFYIGKGVLTSVYGAVGSFIAILTWVYYSSLVLYFGAEFTKAYADRYGSRRRAEAVLQ